MENDIVLLDSEDSFEELRDFTSMPVGSSKLEDKIVKRKVSKRASILSFIMPPSPLRREYNTSSNGDSNSSSSACSPLSPARPTSSSSESNHSNNKKDRRRLSFSPNTSPKTRRRFTIYSKSSGNCSKELQSSMKEEFEDKQDNRQKDGKKLKKTGNQNGSVVQQSAHFRPVRYEVKAELDALFGLSRDQKRERNLCTKDEDGHIWFDQTEQEEFAQLLAKGVDSPSCFSRRSSLTSSACGSPTTAQSRHYSLLASSPMTFSSSGRQDVASFHYSPMEWSPSAMQSFTLKDDKDEIGFDMINRRKKRDALDTEKGNCVIDEVPLHAQFTSKCRDGDELDDLPKIEMPAFLPIKRNNADEDCIAEAFANPFESNTEVGVGSSQMERQTSRRLQQYSRKERPADLHLLFKDILDLDRNKIKDRSVKRVSMICSPKDLPSSSHCSSNDEEDSYIRYLQRRRSSFDSSDLSPYAMKFPKSSPLFRGSLSPSSPALFPHRKQNSGTSKADALLGKNSINEKLLVPGGLSTGLHVYDGVEIPCRSVHLPSDDEDEIEEKLAAKTNSKMKKSRSNLKSWLTGKSGI